MSSSSQSGSNRKFLWLSMAILGAIGIYTAGWFYAANKLEETVLRVLTPNEAKSVSGNCENMEFRGFPFRIGMFCSNVTVNDADSGIAAKFGALRSTAAVYAPTHIVWELDSPAAISNPQGLSLEANWTNLHSSLFTKGRGIERSSTIIEGLSTSLGQDELNITADKVDMHLRQNGADLDAAMTLSGTEIKSPAFPQLFPKFTGVADVTLAERAGLIDGSDPRGLKGAQGELRRLAADIGGGSTMILSGSFSVAEDGLLDGQLKLQIENLDQWASNAKSAVPGMESTIDTAKNLLSALNGGRNTASVDLTIRKGRVTAGGLIPVGEIPAL